LDKSNIIILLLWFDLQPLLFIDALKASEIASQILTIRFFLLRRTYVAHARGRRKYIHVGLIAAIQAANTSFTSYASPLLHKS
jgi:hypothetical protein